MSWRALKGRGNLIGKKAEIASSLRSSQWQFILWDLTACSDQSEGLFFTPRDDTEIIAFVLDYKKGMSLILASGFVGILRIAAYILKALCLLLYLVKHLTKVARIIDLRNI